ncbi:short chain dehydrogenase [Mycolicibacterium phlei]|uniref:SDR family oxidoreductase n=1 Tax=Mycobacteroides chelonae TaxID=1774 RepID=UPI000618C2D5|nr:SDR family oxidoreductase [Mycobacteroides chelonae]VEG16254.1 short chain dehydrogenase [Mycolicibacterium phlei]AKC38843.1 short-chain dehydrogenase [Mycobacteroides chelonae]ANA98128.1 short-chain dehydrogenase [Mycobacteroides chelonae CCUG 47445]OLT77933.1 short-chain dehydrogenase [Mycobacteroides chelonae]ORV13688.1 short-chain dehydrogenase [Mycobacteroides chelonae]
MGSTLNNIAGKTVMITGGAGGIGVEVAHRLHAKGANLVLTDLDETKLAAVADDLGRDRVLVAVADVCDLAALEGAVAQAVERFGGIDVVLANAGLLTFGSVLQVDPATFKKLIDVNVLGVFHTVRAALPSVIERKGYVLIVSSLAAYAAAPGVTAYNASKAAVEHFANALRLEVAHRGVDVGSAHMSWIDTSMVNDQKANLSAFSEMLTRLPPPLRTVTSVEACGKAFVKGIEKRRRRINCPGWVGVTRWLKPVLSTSLGELPMRGMIPEILPRMDAEVAAVQRAARGETGEA